MQKLRPWSVKGVSEEAREAARSAAAVSDLAIGAWIDHAIRDATANPNQSPAIPPPPNGPAGTTSVGAAIAELEDTITNSQSVVAATVGPVRDALEDLALRIDTLERHRRLLPHTTLFIDKDSRPTASSAEHDEPKAAQTARRKRKDRGDPRHPDKARSHPRTRRAGRLIKRVLVGTALMSSGLIAAFVAVWFALFDGPGESILIGANFTNALTRNAVGELPRTLPLQLPADPPQANIGALRLKAERGNVEAQSALAILFVQGRTLTQDYAAATYWFTQAATAGLASAQYNLGIIYSRGLGVEPNATQATIWFHSAAEQGYVKAQYALGLAYAQASGVEQNYPEAAAWLQRAAEQADADAQFALATLLEDGVAGPADPDGAYYWYQAAVANGNRQAAERAALLVPRLASTSAGQALPSAPPLGAPQITRQTIQEIQRLLAGLDFFTAQPTGVMDAGTSAAIRDYQAQLGLRVDGQATAGLLQHLRTVTSVQ